MTDAIRIAASGLQAAGLRTAKVVSNIANMRSEGRREPYDGYRPQSVAQATAPDGGVKARLVSSESGLRPVYSPDSPFADGQGLVGAPDVDLASEMVDLVTARHSYDASLKVMEAAEEMQRLLVDERA